MRLINRTSALALFILSAGFGQAGLITSDFLSPGDNLLVTDTNTNLQWLKPSYTSSHTFDDAFVQNIISTYGFSYSDEPTVLNMINSNFGNPPVGSPGSPTGFTDAQNFFNVFGINEPTTCTVGMGTVPCPRTQGLTSTSTSAGTHDADGMIQLDTDGWLIENNQWIDNGSDPQMGSWLVRQAVVGTTPEPASFGLIGLGFAAIAIRLRRR